MSPDYATYLIELKVDIFKTSEEVRVLYSPKR